MHTKRDKLCFKNTHLKIARIQVQSKKIIQKIYDIKPT